MICKHCGYANGAEAKYCARCGKKLNRESKPEKREMAIFATLFLLIGIFAGMGISGYFRNENRTVGHKSDIAQVLPMEDGSVAVLYGSCKIFTRGLVAS